MHVINHDLVLPLQALLLQNNVMEMLLLRRHIFYAYDYDLYDDASSTYTKQFKSIH